MSDEQRLKISLSKQGRGNGREGTKHSEETKERIRQARVGKNYFIPSKKGIRNSPESIEVVRQKQIARFKDKTKHPMFGKRFSEESRLKMSRSHLGQTPSLDTRKKLSICRSGDKHWNWREDRSTLQVSDHKHLDSKYKIWMLAVKKRDGWKCQAADNTCSGRLEAHHIYSWRGNPKLRYSPNNGITLCHAHHPRGEAEEKRHVAFFLSLIHVSVLSD